MPTVKYATDAQVMGAIERWGGNVTAAADELGIQPKNLRKRLETLGINLKSVRFREGPAGAVAVAPSLLPGPHRVHPAPVASSRTTGRETGSGLSRSARDAPIFRNVQTAEADTDRDESPVKGVRVRPKPLRLRPAHQDRLRDAKLDLGARYRVETDENTILDQFFEEAFDGWLKSKLDPAAAAKPRNGKPRGDGGDRK